MTVLEVDFDKPGHAMLGPLLAARIQAFAEKADPFVNAALLAGVTLSQLWMRDPGVKAHAILDPADGTVVGHVLSQYQPNGQGVGRPTVTIIQSKADKDVGDAVAEAYHQVESWARSKHAVALVMISGRDAEVLDRKYGFKLSRRVFHKLLTEDTTKET